MGRFFQVDLIIATLLCSHFGPASEYDVTHGKLLLGRFSVRSHATGSRRLAVRQADLFMATLLFSHFGPASEHEVTHGKLLLGRFSVCSHVTDLKSPPDGPASEHEVTRGNFAWLPTGNECFALSLPRYFVVPLEPLLLHWLVRKPRYG